jgi:biotin operon repressor
MKSDLNTLLEILTLAASGQSYAAIAKTLKLSKAQVQGRATRAKAAGKTIESLRAELKGTPAPKGKPAPQVAKRTTTPARAGHTLDDFRSKFDVGAMIEAKVAELLPEDGEQWFHDSDFRVLCGVSIQNWRRHADEYPQYQFKKGKFHAWAPLHMVEEMQTLTGHAG